MGFGVTSAQVKSFAAQAFIQKALKTPFQVASVLSYFFNVDFHDPSHVQAMKTGDMMESMIPFWYGGHKDYDVLGQGFQDAIRAVGKGELNNNNNSHYLGSSEEEWQTTVNGKMAQLLLCDQISRNAFRGSEEAFAYDETATIIARELCREIISECNHHNAANDDDDKTTYKEKGIGIPSLEGEIYPPYLQFVISPLMHSESVDDHSLALGIAEYSIQVAPDHLTKAFENTRAMEVEHKEVIDRFGRYPHRNAKLGRKSTLEELEWLAQEDELPGWAKSQK